MYADLLDGCYHNKSILWMKSVRSYGFVVAVAVALFIVINELVDFYGLRYGYVGTKRTTQIGVHTARNNSWAGDRTTTTVNINNVVICKCGLTFYLCLFKNAFCISDFSTALVVKCIIKMSQNYETSHSRQNTACFSQIRDKLERQKKNYHFVKDFIIIHFHINFAREKKNWQTRL